MALSGNFTQDFQDLNDLADQHRHLMELAKMEWKDINKSISGVLGKYKDISKKEKELAYAKKLAKDQLKEAVALQRRMNLLTSQANQDDKDAAASKVAQADQAVKLLDLEEQRLATMKSQLSITKGIMNSLGTKIDNFMVNQLKSLPGFLDEADQSMRNAALEMGIAGVQAERMRNAMIDASAYGAQFGVEMKDLAAIQTAYAKETGKINMMNSANIKAITLIAKGTSLGVEAASEMAGQYEMVGISAVRVAENVEAIVNQTQAVGINASVVLGEINANFKRAQSFTFKNGVKGLENMAINAQKFKISMESTFNAAEKARTLEGSLEMAAQLMNMGGNFAKQDPFQLSFLARNDPEKFQKALADMTKGVASFNRTTGEISVSSLDMERLRVVSEATGVSIDDLKKSAMEFTKIDMAKKSIFVGSAEDKEMLARMSTMDKNGNFSIDVDGSGPIALSKLTQGQVELLKAEQKTLEQRAKESQGFGQIWDAFVLEAKTTLMPLLKYATSMLRSMHDVTDTIRKAFNGNGMKVFAGAATALWLASKSGALSTIAGSVMGGAGKLMGGKGSPSLPKPSMGGGGGKGLGSMLGGGGGLATAATIAAIGVAAVGLGYGFKMASEGAATLAGALKGLNPDQLGTLEHTLVGLGVGMGALIAASFLVGSNPLAIAGLLAMGGAVSLIGFGIKMATEGIGDMAKNISALAGMDMGPMGEFFYNASKFMEGSPNNFLQLRETVQSIAQVQTQLVEGIKNAFKDGIEVKLKGDGKMIVHVDVHNEIDKQKFTNSFTKEFAVAMSSAKKGFGSL